MKNYFEKRFCEYLDSEWPVVIGNNEYQGSDVFKVYAPADYESALSEWIEIQKSEAREKVKEILSDNGCLQRFNRLAERTIEDQVLPFVGAGMSKPSGFLLWEAFLKEVAREDPALLLKIEARINDYDYEGAAQEIADHFNENILAESVENHFDRRVFEIRGPVGLLPALFKRGCVTTNFDCILERVFKDNQLEFEEVFAGEEVRGMPRAVANDGHVIAKLHGAANNPRGRVLTTAEYDSAYGDEGALSQILSLLVSNRSLLFMGCSLGTDRTISALRHLKTENRLDLPRHYAFLEDPGPEQRVDRRSELDQAEIHPIWYPVENPEFDHDGWIESLLVSLHGGPIDD